LQASLYAGCPPLLSLNDYDTQPAGNFDDEQLENDEAIARPETCPTQSSISIILRKTFPARLAIARFLNNFTSTGTYEETLQHDLDLRAGYKTLRQTLRAFDSSHGNLPSDFQIRVLDTIMNRYLCAVHTPFLVPALTDTKYAYSRKTVFDTALKMWYATFPASKDFGSSMANGTTPPASEDFQRMVTCGHGFLRSATMLSILMIAVEVRTQFQEDDGLGPTPLRGDLFAILEEAKTWSIWCMEAGETNIKGHVFVCLMRAYTQGLAKGLGRADISRSLVEASHDALQRGMELLEKMIENEMPEQSPAGLGDLSIDDLTPEMLADWQSIVSRVVCACFSCRADPKQQMSTDMTDPYGYDMMNWAFDATEVQNTWLF
jgi:hypothetical protein